MSVDELSSVVDLASHRPQFKLDFLASELYKISGANPTIASYNASVVNFYNV
jgi:hypothetical protein